jgi:hypothetical protein
MMVMGTMGRAWRQVRLQERMGVMVMWMGGIGGVRLQERMNSPLERRKVRLRGLGGLTVCGVPDTGASATG